MEYLYNKQVLYIAAGLIVSSIILFIAGFYSGSLMTTQIYHTVEQDSQVAEAEVDADFPNELTASEPTGAGLETIIKSASAAEVQTNTASLENDHINTAIVKENVANNMVKQNKPEKETPKQPDNVHTQSTPTDKANKSTDLYALQVGSFLMEGNALSLSHALTVKGYNPRIILTILYPNNKPDKQYKVLIGLFPNQELAIEEAYRYTIKERTPVYVVPSPVWRVNNDKMEIARKGVYIDHHNLQ